MTPLLILYIDSDFIYPVVSAGHGEYEKYEHPDRELRDFRLWLYFEEDKAGGRVKWVKRARAGFLSGNPACRGDIFRMFGSAEGAEAQRLLSDSGIVSELKALYSAGGSRPETDIPTAYVFAGNISEEARRAFMSYMQSRSFATLSYSVSLENLAAATMAADAKFGDKLLTFASSGNDLVASSFVFDSKEFMLSERPKVMENLGYNPVREALVHYVVNKIESKQHFLVSEERLKAEIEYQKQNVDEWLKDIDPSDSVSTIPFRYNNRANEYQVTVETDLLRHKQNDFIDHLLQEMNTYRTRAARSSDSPVSRIILIGEMFADDNFRSRVAASIGRGALLKYVPTDDFPAVLALYPILYPELHEKLNDFEKVRRRSEDKEKNTGKFIDNADKLRGIADEAAALATDFENLAVSLTREMDAALGSVDKMLEISNFNGAEECLDRASLPEANSSIFAREKALGQTVALNQELLANPNAEGIASQIKASLAAIAQWHAKVDEQLKRGENLREEIARLRRDWPEYQRLMAEFESAEVSRKRAIVDEIASRRLTREALPVTGLTSPFLARIEASVGKSGGFMGFGGKKTLNVSVLTAEGYATECKTVVLVQDSPLVTVKPANIRATIEAHFSGRQNLDPIPLPLDGTSKSKRLYIYLKPALDQAISINDPFMSVKSVEIDI